MDLVRQQARELLREQKEGERVAYVAATRARDVLVVPAIGDAPYEGGWVAPLTAAIYPAEDVRRVQRTAAGCPAFGSKDSVLWRPDGDPATKLTVCPGGHTLSTAHEEWSVAWWSPDALSLDVPATFGLRRDDLIVKDVPPLVLKSHLEAYHAWHADREAAIKRAAVPSLAVITATEAALGETPVSDDIEVAVEIVPGPASGAAGRRFGTLVHALLADVPLVEAAAETTARLAAAHGRVLGADDVEIESARVLVAGVLAHPVLRAAAAASANGRCYRETPVTLRLDDSTLVEGLVDLVFEDSTGFVIVDFKTDHEVEGALDRYTRQVRIYADAIRSATGKRVRAVLMRLVSGESLLGEPLPPAVRR
jgi:ATP-dependent exoDNAse (exonuclease V) beta subunit